MKNELAQYAPLGLLLVLALGFGLVNLVLPSLIGQKRVVNPVKDSPYECGLPTERLGSTRFSVRFYLVAMLFILFDLEVVFVVSWATEFRHLVKPIAEGGIGPAAFWAMVLFIAMLEVGHFYVWKRGALNWGSRATRPKAPHVEKLEAETVPQATAAGFTQETSHV
jgi:NADH-quinone oxidoreductase subunit A